MLKRHFSKARPILEAVEEAVIVCMLPLPRFVLKPCCGNKEHISNFSEGDFKEILKAAATSCKEVISAEGEMAGLALCAFNPVAAFRGGEKLAAKTNSAGLSVWRADDPPGAPDSGRLQRRRGLPRGPGQPCKGQLKLRRQAEGKQRGTRLGYRTGASHGG